jgi:hypothetical protein
MSISTYIFVATATADASGFVDNGSKQRVDSVNDIKKNLTGHVNLVNEAEAADIIVEVTDRGGSKTGNVTTTSDILGVHSRGDTVAVVYVNVTAGDYKTQFVGSSPDGQKFGVWGAAAAQVAKQVEQFANTNHNKLIAQRAAARAN